MLASDGSFYCLDRYLMQQLGIGDNTIRRARIYLKESGEIDYSVGKHKGAPTRYWILSKDAKMEPFKQAEQAKMTPFDEGLKSAKLEPKEAKLVVEASQNGTLNNKLLIKSENKNLLDSSCFSQEDKDGIRAFARVYGVAQTIDFLVRKGFALELIKEMLKGVDE